MTFSQYAGIAIVPTLSRIVLCAAFFTAGYNKVFTQADFTAAEAQKLQTLGVNATPPAAPPIVSSGEWSRQVVPASFEQDGPVTPSAQPDSPQGRQGENDQSPATQPTDDAPVVPPAGETSTTRSAAPHAEGAYRAQSMHKLTLMLDGKGWPQPRWQALMAACTELIGGGLLLFGLFSRVWGLGLAIAMGVAFYLTTMNPYFSVGPLQVGGGMGMVDGAVAYDGHKLFNTVFCQLSLGLLAFGIVLTGPGPLSLDRILFGRGREVVEADPVKAD